MAFVHAPETMLFPNDAQPGSLAHAMRLQSTLSVMDTSVRGYIFEQLREAEVELHIQQAVTRQLEAELQAEIHRDHKSGTENSLLFQKLPPEIRAQIFSYVVAADQSVHVFPPKGNETHGYRLSLCDESSYDFDLGHCRCDDSRTRGSVTSNFFDNAIFLVSQRVRREALDAFFLTNKFTFTCLYELVRFTSSFKASSSKIQHIRIFERVDDYPNSDFRVKGIQKARQRLKALKHLEIYVFLSSWSAYETLHEDGLVNQLLHFALGPPPATPPAQPQQTRKRKLSETSNETIAETNVQKVTKVAENPSRSENITTISISADQNPSLTSSPTTSEASLSSLSDSKRTEYIEDFLVASIPPQSPSTSATEPSTTSSFTTTTGNGTSTDTTTTTSSSCTDPQTLLQLPPSPPFPIPPLKSFNANVRLRNIQVTLRRPETSKAEYYANLYTRLTDHLTDVFLDNGKKYRVIEDIPSLGPRPKLKVRDDERALTGAEKRGILYLKD